MSSPSTAELPRGRATRDNRELYDEFWQSCPDFVRYNPGARQRRRHILSTLKPLRFGSLLDVGCGDGELLRLFRVAYPEGVHLHGVDLSPATVAENRTRVPFATFDVLDLQEEALADQFDAVVCTEVIEHMDDQARAVLHLSRMVAPGGHLLVTCPTGKVHATERHFGHVTHPTPGALRDMLTSAGLDVIRVTNWGFPIMTALKYATNLRADWALKSFGTSRYTLSQKLLCHALYATTFLSLPSSPLGCQLFALAHRPA